MEQWIKLTISNPKVNLYGEIKYNFCVDNGIHHTHKSYATDLSGNYRDDELLEKAYANYSELINTSLNNNITDIHTNVVR